MPVGVLVNLFWIAVIIVEAILNVDLSSELLLINRVSVVRLIYLAFKQ